MWMVSDAAAWPRQRKPSRVRAALAHLLFIILVRKCEVDDSGSTVGAKCLQRSHGFLQLRRPVRVGANIRFIASPQALLSVAAALIHILRRRVGRAVHACVAHWAAHRAYDLLPRALPLAPQLIDGGAVAVLASGDDWRAATALAAATPAAAAAAAAAASSAATGGDAANGTCAAARLALPGRVYGRAQPRPAADAPPLSPRHRCRRLPAHSSRAASSSSISRPFCIPGARVPPLHGLPSHPVPHHATQRKTSRRYCPFATAAAATPHRGRCYSQARFRAGHLLP